MLKLLVFCVIFGVVYSRPQTVRLHRPTGFHANHPSLFPRSGLEQEDEYEDFTDKPLLSSKIIATPPQPVIPGKIIGRVEPSDYERYQNQNARYQFSSDIDDKISDLTHQRMEVREGSAVKGSYSYSDGYYKRTVHYEADEKGYRVTGMEAVPLDLEGPHVDLSGTASVSNAAHGTQVHYKVVSVPVPGPVAKVVDPLQQSLIEV